MITDKSLEVVANFRFAAPSKGFRCIENPTLEGASGKRKTSGTYFLRNPRDGWGNVYQLVDPKIAELFLEFSRVELSKDPVLAFANKYGPLGVEDHTVVNGTKCPVESLRLWILEILFMRNAVDLATAITMNNRKQLQDWLKIGDGGDTVHFQRTDKDNFTTTRTVDSGRAISRFVEKNRWKRAATIILHEMINDHLRKNSGVGVTFNSRRSELAIELKLDNLLAVMWMQFANLVVPGRITRCKGCNDLMLLTASSSRRKKKTCSTKCRKRKSRQ